jgi:hypothetical protein
MALAGLTIMLFALIHSLVDYPLRMHSVAAIVAIALAFFQMPAPQSQQVYRRVRPNLDAEVAR